MTSLIRKILTVLFCMYMSSASSTTVLKLHLNEMLIQSELVFEGEVVSSEARWNDKKTNIRTYVIFKIDDVIKGDFTSETLRLGFGGGTVDGMTLKIAGMEYPKVGQQGIFFIEQIKRPQVNPLIGWSQGHFRISRDEAGTERVMTANRKPVLGMEETNSAIIQSRAARAFNPFSEGVAEGLSLGQGNEPLSNAMDKKLFKTKLKLRLENLKSLDGAE